MGGNSRQNGGKGHYEKGPRHARPRGQSRGSEGWDRHSEPSRAKAAGRRPRGGYRERAKTENDLPNVSQISKFASLVCPYCGETIKDITGAIAGKGTGEPAHFDCVLKLLEGSEPHEENETIVYIGQGNFAVVIFENPADTRKFKIVRTIEWEDRNAKLEWRTGILDYYDLSKPVF